MATNFPPLGIAFGQILDLSQNLPENYNMERLLEFLINHNQTLVALSALFVAFFCMLWFVLNYKNLNSEPVVSAQPLLNKKSKIKTKAHSAVDPEAAEKLATKVKDIERLKHRLETQQKKLESKSEVEAQLATAEQNIANLEEKVQELESYLEDYELIEDDIANLSRFRSQNDRLLEKLREFSPDDAERLEKNFIAQLKADEESDQDRIEDDKNFEEEEAKDPELKVVEQPEETPSKVG